MELIPDDTTPLDPDESEGLLVPGISTRGALNKIEQLNIDDALRWLSRQKHTIVSVTDDLFLRNLHKHMFGQVWSWAGRYRTTLKNIGVEPELVAISVRDACKNARLWVEHPGDWSHDQIAVRYHYLLVRVHPFANGNGRWSRLAGDLLVQSLGEPIFSWGGTSLGDPTETRAQYLAALRQADSGKFHALIKFARA